ncbi:MAG: hypothetical protein ACYC9D_13160, partial [Candidatus Dormibacteria bacterium]
SRPAKIEAAEMLDNTATLRHHPLRVSAVLASTAKAEVWFLAAACGGGTCIAVQAAGVITFWLHHLL